MPAQRDLLTKVGKLLSAGALKSTLSATLTGMNADSMREAHRRVEEGKMIGKIAVTR